jgi:PAS domain-containing protein
MSILMTFLEYVSSSSLHEIVPVAFILVAIFTTAWLARPRRTAAGAIRDRHRIRRGPTPLGGNTPAAQLQCSNEDLARLDRAPVHHTRTTFPSQKPSSRNIMNHTFAPSPAPFVNCVDCDATIERLIGNLSGFLYRRRNDPLWTMEFVSSGCRDITGYDPHRFLGNASLAFGELIARSDWRRVNERVRFAIRHRRRATVEYLIRTAHGVWLKVEDRLIPVVNADGKVLAIEGIIDRARCSHATPADLLPFSDDARFGALSHSPSSN